MEVVFGFAAPELAAAPGLDTPALVITLAGGVLSDVPSLDAALSIFRLIGEITRYECVLSAAGYDDLTLPISSFQGRFRSGDPSFLAVVVPTLAYAEDVAARSTAGVLTVFIIRTDLTNTIREALISVDLEDIRTDEGANSQSMTLSGHRTETFEPKTVMFNDVYYHNLQNSLHRYRCKPDLYFRPGDTAVIDGNTITADLVTWAVNVGQELMEIAEEA